MKLQQLNNFIYKKHADDYVIGVFFVILYVYMPKSFLTKLTLSFFAVMLMFEGFALSASAQDVASDVVARRAKLTADLATLDNEIAAQQTILDQTQKQGVSLERDLAILSAQIEKTKLSIRASVLAIQGIVEDIGVKNNTIGKYSAKIANEQDSLAGLMRRTNELDNYSLVEVALSDQDLSNFFSDLDNFQYVEDSVSASLDRVGVAKKETEAEKAALEEKKAEETGLRRLRELEQSRLNDSVAEKNALLKETKGQELAYQKILKDKQKSAAQIRSELFNLQGSTAISFEKALAYARLASSKTGVRPALILGIIAEESNLGQNVGTGTWTVDMKNPRDTEPFKLITASLGLNPDKMPVSKKAWYGWGGAMGPAQFIPSTWVLYIDRIAALTGHNPPNPWDPSDAFSATALLMKDNGAAKGTPSAERFAALCYLAGCTNAKKKSYAFYGDDVMALATKYQNQIDILGQ